MRIATLWMGIAALAAGGCQRDESPVRDKLDEMDQRLARMERQIASVAAIATRGAPKKQRRPRPDPEKTYSIPVDGAPITGNPNAAVTIVEGFEFACGWCEKSRSLVAEVLAEYGDEVRLVHKGFMVHPDVARTPALAACAANRQGKFGAIEPLIWDKGFKKRKLDAAHMVALAREAGLDVGRFERDMKSAECADQVKRDHAQLAAVGVSGTPTFYINGRWLPRRNKAEFARLIDEELARARERIAAGTEAGSYYAEWVVEKGARKL